MAKTNLTAGTLKTPTITRLTATGTTTGYLFTISTGSATEGATYTNNGNTYTVLATVSSGTQLYCSGAGTPTGSGTLTKASGTGDTTITFSANRAMASYFPPQNCLYISVKMVGGGGGGGGGASTSPGVTAGSNGFPTIFGTNLLIANNGNGATTSVAGGAGGAGGSTTVNSPAILISAISGGSGSGSSAGINNYAAGGSGAPSPFGGAGGSGPANTGSLVAIANTGSGGGGGGSNASTTQAGGGGGGAGGYIEALIMSPSSSYVYAVGAGGNGGAAGTSGTAGGAGATGVIEITEHYTFTAAAATSTGGGAGLKNYIASITTSNGVNALSGNFDSGSATSFSLASTTLSTTKAPTSTLSAGTAFTSANGAPSSNIALTFNAVSTNNIAGAYSGSLASTGTSTAGNMLISNAFYIDKEDYAKVMQVKFYYNFNTLSATNADFSGTYNNSFAVWIYDVSRGSWIQPSGSYGITQTGGVGMFTGTFQTSSDSSQYQVALINTSSLNNNYTIIVDDFFVGPQVTAIGAAMTDWQDYTPTLTGFGTATGIEFQYRRVGSDVEIRGKFISGTVTAVEARVTLPSGLTSADTSKIPSIQMVGAGTWGMTTPSSAAVLIEPSANYVTFGVQASAYAGLTKATGSTLISSSTQFSFFATIPIAGWSSNVQSSSDTDTRIVDFIGTAGSGQSLTANVTNITATTVKDSHGSWSGSTYVIPVSGDYEVSGSLQTNAASQTPFVYKNGTVVTNGAFCSVGSANFYSSGAVLIPNCVAGDIISLRNNTLSTVTSCYIGIKRLSGPSVINATETVSASYWVSTNVNASGTQPINYNSKEFDTHGAVTVSSTAWRFTAPVSGIYSIQGLFYANNVSAQFNIFKNDASYKFFAYNQVVTGGYPASATTSIRLNAGEYIDIRPLGPSVTITGGTLAGSASTNSICITRTGN